MKDTTLQVRLEKAIKTKFVKKAKKKKYSSGSEYARKLIMDDLESKK